VHPRCLRRPARSLRTGPSTTPSLYRDYPAAYIAYSVYRFGHDIISVTRRRNEPFIAALLGCCFLSQATFSPPQLLSPPSPRDNPLPPFCRARTRARPRTRCVASRVYVCARARAPMHASRRCTCARSRTLRAVALACRQVFVGICSSAVLITAVAPLPAATRLKDDLSRERIVRLYSRSCWRQISYRFDSSLYPCGKKSNDESIFKSKALLGTRARHVYQIKIRIYFQYTSVDF